MANPAWTCLPVPRLADDGDFVQATQKVLAVTYGGGHISMILPALRGLKKRLPELEVTVLALTTSLARARKVGLDCFGYSDLIQLFPEWTTQAQLHGERLSASNSHPEVSAQESIAYLGLNWMDLVCQHGEVCAQSMYAHSGRAAFYPITVLRRLIQSLAPDFVLTTNSPRSEQAAVQAAVEMGIPCLSMFDLFPIENDPYAARAFQADVTTVVSSQARETLIRAGMSADKISVTGNPAFDELTAPQHLMESKNLLTKLGWGGRDVVLFAGYSEPSAHGIWPAGTAFPLAIEHVLRQLVHQHSKIALLIRQHPNSWNQYLEAWKKHPPHPRVHISLLDDESVECCILASQIVVVQASTVGLQSAIAGKSVLAMEESPSIYSASFSWSALGVARGVAVLKDLPAAVLHALETPRAISLDIPVDSTSKVIDLICGRLAHVRELE